MQLAPHLHRVGTGLVNAYLVEEAGAVTVIDTGMPGMYRELEAELRTMSRTTADIRGIVLTHGDTDHTGFAGRLAAETGLAIQVHEADVARAHGEVRKPMRGWGPVKAGPLLGFLAYGLRHGGLGVPKVGELHPVAGEATLDLPGSPRLVPLPGHTPGSVAVHVPSLGVLCVGDAMTTRSVLTGEVGPRLAPFTLDPASALDSLRRLDGIEAAWLLPGHGEPWTDGVDVALREIRAAAAARPAPVAAR